MRGGGTGLIFFIRNGLVWGGGGGGGCCCNSGSIVVGTIVVRLHGHAYVYGMWYTL